jgi:hypothetical protein
MAEFNLSFLQPHDGPVIDDLKEYEVVYAESQPEYIPLRSLRSRTPEARVLSRWSLTPEQRQMIADGADVYLELSTFGGPLQPIRMAVSTNIHAEYFRVSMNFPAAKEPQTR